MHSAWGSCAPANRRRPPTRRRNGAPTNRASADRRYPSSHSLLRRAITAEERLGASLPSRAARASWKSPAEIPRRIEGATGRRASRLLVRRALFGRMFDVNRIRAPGGAPRSRAFGFCTSTEPKLGSGSREPDHGRGEPPVGGHPEAPVPRSRPEMSRTPPRPPGQSADAHRFAEFRSVRVVDCPFLSKGNNSILGHGVTLLLGGSGGLITNPVTPPSSHRHPVPRLARRTVNPASLGPVGRSETDVRFFHLPTVLGLIPRRLASALRLS